jgi:hypothetical protein
MDALKRTMIAANTVCNDLSAWAWDTQTFGQYPIHKGQYHIQRSKSGLAAQVVIRSIAKVADSYKLDKNCIRKFRPMGAVCFDNRIVSFRTDKSFVSIWTVDGRMKLSFECGDYQRELLEFQQGECDLVFVNGNFYLLATCSIPDPPMMETNGVLGVDMGLVGVH